MATKEQVLDLNAKNPTWSTVQIARALGCMDSYVRATLKRNGIRNPNGLGVPGFLSNNVLARVRRARRAKQQKETE